MKKTIEVMYCDVCGKEITGDYLKIDYKEKHYDVCEKCADKFLLPDPEEKELNVTTCCAPAPQKKRIDWDEVIDSVDAGKKEQAAEPDGGAKKKQKITFDAGKAQALRDAGWTVKAIAKEMNAHPVTVYKNTHPAAPKKAKPHEWGGLPCERA